MTQEARQFEAHYSRKGSAVLDDIFGELTPERQRIRLAQPRHEREIVLVVEHNDDSQFSSAVNTLCQWLSEGGEFERLSSLMLY